MNLVEYLVYAEGVEGFSSLLKDGVSLLGVPWTTRGGKKKVTNSELLLIRLRKIRVVSYVRIPSDTFVGDTLPFNTKLLLRSFDCGDSVC